MAAAKEKALAENQARLQGLLADRAAGKHINDLDLRSANRAVADVQQWFAEYERQKLVDAMSRQAKIDREVEDTLRRREDDAALRDQVEFEEAAWERERAVEARSERKYAEREYQAALDEMSTDLANMAQGVGDEESESALRTTLVAIGGLTEDDARLFGSGVHAAWRWMTHGEDATRSFCDAEAFKTLAPASFGSDHAYRAAVSGVQARFVLDELMAPWSEGERDKLALRHRALPSGLPEKHTPALRTAAGDFYLAVDLRRRRVVVYSRDDTDRTASPSVFLPMSETFEAAGSLEVTHPLGGQNFCFDQAGALLYLDGKLYEIGADPFPQPIVELDSAAKLAMLAGEGGAGMPRDPKLGVGLLVRAKDGAPVVLLQARPGGWGNATGADGPIAAFDLTRKEMLWRIPGVTRTAEGAVDRLLTRADLWQYLPDLESFVCAAWRPRTTHEPIPVKLVDGGRAAPDLASAACRPRPPNFSLVLEMRPLRGSEPTATLDLYGRAPGEVHQLARQVRLDFDGEKVRVGQENEDNVVYGTLDPVAFSFTHAPALAAFRDRDTLGWGRIGPNRLHTLAKMFNGAEGTGKLTRTGGLPASLVRRVREASTDDDFSTRAKSTSCWVRATRRSRRARMVDFTRCVGERPKAR